MGMNKTNIITMITFISILWGAHYIVSKGELNKTIETSSQYVEDVIPQITTWNLKYFKGYLSERAIAFYQRDIGDRQMQKQSRLGKLKSFDKPKFINEIRKYRNNGKPIDSIAYNVSAKFESGNATLVFLIKREDGKYKVDRFDVIADILMEHHAS